MKRNVLIILITCLTTSVFGQVSEEFLKGNVSYISSQNVYVKFSNTDSIHPGDTLFVSQNDTLKPILIVTTKSTYSCISSPLGTNSPLISSPVIAKIRVEIKQIEKITENQKEITSVNDFSIAAVLKKKKEKESKSNINGRLSVTSYTNISKFSSNQRFRYNLLMNVNQIGKSNLSFESYISFTHLYSFPSKLNDWQGMNNAMKIYSLALKYDLTKTSSISLGRKVNINMANIGAVDGLQFEKIAGNITFGALIGSRPDFLNYSFNSKLFQYGGFVSHNIKNDNGNMQTSLAFFNQMNNFKTDRIFAYLQHSNSLLKNVDFFSSFEFDLYTMINLQPATTFYLTSTYISLRYKPWKDFSMSISYDARKNIYYFETFKSQIDSILDRETRQGFRFNTNLRPFKYVVFGNSIGYRFQKSGPIPTMNANAFLTYSQIPAIKVSATINAIALKTNYVSGVIYGLSLSRDFLSGKIYSTLEYRKINYQFTYSPTPLLQNVLQLSLSCRVAKKLMVSIDLEATFEKDNNYGRMFINLSKRF